MQSMDELKFHFIIIEIRRKVMIQTSYQSTNQHKQHPYKAEKRNKSLCQTEESSGEKTSIKQKEFYNQCDDFLEEMCIFCEKIQYKAYAGITSST